MESYYFYDPISVHMDVINSTLNTLVFSLDLLLFQVEHEFVKTTRQRMSSNSAVKREAQAYRAWSVKRILVMSQLYIP